MLVSFKGTLISRKMINLKEKYETGWVCFGGGGGLACAKCNITSVKEGKAVLIG